MLMAVLIWKSIKHITTTAKILKNSQKQVGEKKGKKGRIAPRLMKSNLIQLKSSFFSFILKEKKISSLFVICRCGSVCNLHKKKGPYPSMLLLWVQTVREKLISKRGPMLVYGIFEG
jgi:hypothetical protein